MAFATLDDLIGNTPLLALRRINPHPGVTLLVKLEGNNPAGSVKDRAALNLIRQAEASGHLAPGARLIEATSGNTGIALAMVAASRGYRMRLIMPSNMSQERRDAMQAYGAELVLVEGGMEAARTCAMRGHRVTLLEKGDELGGHLISGGAHDFKGEVRELNLWYQGERTSVVEHLDASGWNTTARPRLEVFAEYGRPLAETEDTAALRNSLSVTATKN